MKGRPAAISAAIWGAVLGPGLLTRNPYAGIWLLPLLITLNHSVLMGVITGVVIGMAHGTGRALGVLNNRKRMDITWHILILGAQLRWRFIDGLVLLLTAGFLSAYVFSLATHYL